MGSHTKYHCDNCKVEVDYLDFYDVHVSVRFPIREWDEEHEEKIAKENYWLGSDPMPTYIADGQWCETCYKSKNLADLIGPNRMGVWQQMYGKKFVPKEFHKQPI